MLCQIVPSGVKTQISFPFDYVHIRSFSTSKGKKPASSEGLGEGARGLMLYDRSGMLRMKVIGFEYTDNIESTLKPLL